MKRFFVSRLEAAGQSNAEASAGADAVVDEIIKLKFHFDELQEKFLRNSLNNGGEKRFDGLKRSLMLSLADSEIFGRSRSRAKEVAEAIIDFYKNDEETLVRRQLISFCDK